MDDDTDAVRRELIEMAAEDGRVRADLAADGSLYGGYHPRMEAVHRRNAAGLAAIVGRVGWPGRSLVGDEASRAAWLVLQHAIGEPDFQRRGLAWLRAAADRGDVPAAEVATLDDRVRAFAGEPQLYGTQLDTGDDGRLTPFPLADPAGVDARRAAVGLPPLADAVRARQAEVDAEGPARPPGDRAADRRRFEAWLRAVGWRPVDTPSPG